MSFQLPLSRFSVRAVTSRTCSPQQRTQTLSFRIPRRRGVTLQEVWQELSAYVQQANERRLETESAWFLRCFRTGRQFKAICVQRTS